LRISDPCGCRDQNPAAQSVPAALPSDITIGSSSSCHLSRERKQPMAALVLKMSVSLDGYVATS